MDFGTLNTILWFLVVLSIIVFVHEWGHYYVARRNNVRVEVFSIGFGPEIFGWYDKAGTRWRVSAIPLGGYVRMFGMADEVEETDGQGDRTEPAAMAFLEGDSHPVTEDEREVSFAHKTVGQRAAIVFAGPAINFIFAIVILAAIAMTAGVPNVKVSVGEVIPGSAAEAAGMAPEDVIVSLNGVAVESPRDVQRIVIGNPGVQLPVVITRAGGDVELFVTPQAADQNGETVGRLGIRMQGELGDYEQLNPFMAAWFGIERTAGITWQALVNIGNLLIGQGNFKELGGPIAIAQMSGQAAEQGVLQFFFFMAVLSINLGLINLFPIPILDGGHLLFMGIEALRGKPLGERAQEYGLRIGLALVLLLMVSVTWNDIVRIIGF